MNKIKNLSESSFLKLFFGFVSVSFVVAAFFMPDRAQMFTGLWQIMSNPTKCPPTSSVSAVLQPPS